MNIYEPRSWWSKSAFDSKFEVMFDVEETAMNEYVQDLQGAKE